ncbi:MAG: hypothetical protein KDA78_20180, partial [Planctomycetaceae bacterium]|nr:hypothetical protein [Planctomycetaceae bacterium]
SIAISGTSADDHVVIDRLYFGSGITVVDANHAPDALPRVIDAKLNSRSYDDIVHNTYGIWVNGELQYAFVGATYAPQNIQAGQMSTPYWFEHVKNGSEAFMAFVTDDGLTFGRIALDYGLRFASWAGWYTPSGAPQTWPSEVQGANLIQFNGFAGNDTFINNSSINSIAFGGDGNDRLVGGNQADILIAGSPEDFLGSNGVAYTRQGVYAEVLVGGWGNDMLVGDSAKTNLMMGDEHELRSHFQIYGTSFGNSDHSVNSVDVNQNQIAIEGDTGMGWIHHDTIVGGNNADWIFGQNGRDTIYGNGGNDSILGGLLEDRIMGGDGDDHILGGTGDDFLTGQNGNDWIEGGAGNDILHGGNGNDTLDTGTGFDYVDAGAGSDRIYAHGDGSLLFGGTDNDHDYYSLRSSRDQILDWKNSLRNGVDTWGAYGYVTRPTTISIPQSSGFLVMLDHFLHQTEEERLQNELEELFSNLNLF